MSEFKLSTPVAFIIFNRPDVTEKVFAEIAKAKPPKLLVIADGARKNRIGEDQKVAETRAIINKIDWPCEVLTNFSEVNLGCKNRVASGLDWVFEQVEEAIILEDDCLPHPTFFRFCQEMLDKYRHDQRIGMISGDNFQFGKNPIKESYYFSRYTHIWGWASWRRAWKNYDRDVKFWPEVYNSGFLRRVMNSSTEYIHWENAFQGVYEGKIDTWDYQWTLSVWRQGMLTILPEINLISNIGFGPEATHTFGTSIFANIPADEIKFPLIHPETFIPNFNADGFTSKIMFSTPLRSKVRKFIRSLVPL